jgi:hypothetical protein
MQHQGPEPPVVPHPQPRRIQEKPVQRCVVAAFDFQVQDPVVRGEEHAVGLPVGRLDGGQIRGQRADNGGQVPQPGGQMRSQRLGERSLGNVLVMV